MSRPVVSIVIVNWNTRTLLAACLESVHRQTLLSHEIWVVDNGSTDGSCEMVREAFPEVRLIANEDNKGFAAANNQALPLCTGEHVLLLNSDTVVLDGAIDKMATFLQLHPEAGGVGCKLLNADGTLQPSAHGFYRSWRSLVENRLVHLLWPRRHARTPFLSFWDHNQVRPVDWVTGAALMVRRSVIQEVGLLDDGFFMYGEEVDWQYRMKQAGRRVFFLPSARVIHYGGASSRHIVTQMKRQEYESRLRFVQKHYPPVAARFYRAKAELGVAFWRLLGRLRRQPLAVR